MRISDWSSDVCSSDLYARQDVAAFKPRVDRDAVVLPGSGPSAEAFPFLRIQFFQQGLENYEYETYNGTAALEWKPNDDLKFRSEEHTSELQSLMRISYAVFCLKKKKKNTQL